jgi:hypothetical protein
VDEDGSPWKGCPRGASSAKRERGPGFARFREAKVGHEPDLSPVFCGAGSVEREASLGFAEAAT